MPPEGRRLGRGKKVSSQTGKPCVGLAIYREIETPFFSLDGIKEKGKGKEGKRRGNQVLEVLYHTTLGVKWKAKINDVSGPKREKKKEEASLGPHRHSSKKSKNGDGWYRRERREHRNHREYTSLKVPESGK